MRTAVRTWVALTFALLALGADGPAIDRPMFKEPLLLGAHRGGAAVWPENTLVAFRAAADRWPGILLEADARLTSDGEVVLQHDLEVDRTTDGTGPIDAMTFAQVRKLDAAYRFTTDGGQSFPERGKGIQIPTLKEVLEALPDSRFLIELKDQPGIADAVAKVIEETGARDRVMIASFKPAHMARFREVAPGVVTCYDTARGMAMLQALRAGDWDGYTPTDDVLSVEKETVAKLKITPDELRAIQKKGIVVQVHTLDDPTEIREMLQTGVDSILSDRPDVLAATIEEAQKKPG